MINIFNIEERLGLRCYINPFGGGNSSSATSSTNTSATGGGQAQNNAHGSAQAAPNSIAVGQSGKYNESGTLDLSGSKGTVVTIGDNAQLAKLAGDFAQENSSIANNAISAANSSNVAANNQFLQGLQSLAMSQQTGGLTPVMETFLWLALGGMVLLAIIFRKRNN